MKRFLACLVCLFIAVVAMIGQYARGRGMQENLHIHSSVPHAACEISATFGHAIAYAENGSYTAQTLTVSNHSPHSGLHTASIGGRVPSVSPGSSSHELGHTNVQGVLLRSVRKLYVLRV